MAKRYRPIFDLENKELNVRYHIDLMLNRTLSMFKWEGLPESLPEVDLELILQTMGKGIVTEHNGDLVMFWGNWGARKDLYYHPTSLLVANPWADVFKEFEFDKDCVLMRNDPLFAGLLPIFEKYGVLNAEADLTFRNAMVIFRAMLNLIAPDDRAKASADAYLDRLVSGKFGTMLDDSWSENNGIQNPTLSSSIQGYLTQIIEGIQYLKGSEMNDLGLQSNFNMKRERLSEAESSLNEDALRPLVDSMLEERVKACEKINKMFGTDISVSFGSSWAKWNPEQMFAVGDMPEEGESDGSEGVRTVAEEAGEEGEDRDMVSESSDPTGEPVVTDGSDDTPVTVEELAEEVVEILEAVAEDVKEEITDEDTVSDPE